MTSVKSKTSAVAASIRSEGSRCRDNCLAAIMISWVRTASLMPAFGPALKDADHIVLTDIYGAGEEPIAGVTIDVLAESIRRSTTVPVDLVTRLDDVAPAVARITRRGDVVITLGAGSISVVPGQLIELLKGASA